MNEKVSLHHIAHLVPKPFVPAPPQIPEYQDGFVYVILATTSRSHHEMGSSWSESLLVLGHKSGGWALGEPQYVVFSRPEDAFAYKLENKIDGEVFPMKLMTTHQETKESENP